MKKVTMYEANDSRLFMNEEECIKHEEKIVELKNANDLLEKGGTFKDALEIIGIDAPFAEGITNKTILSGVFYGVSIDYDGQVYIKGVGGEYGSWATLQTFEELVNG